MSAIDPLRLFHGPCYQVGDKQFQTYATDAASRVDIVRKSNDIEALLDAVDLVSVSVRKAILRRIRKLEKSS